MLLEHILNLTMLISHIGRGTQVATATYYSPKYENRLMANGKPYHSKDYAVAFNKWPVGTWIRIYNPLNGKEVIACVTDKKVGKGLDLSERIYDELKLSRKNGLSRVLITRMEQ